MKKTKIQQARTTTLVFDFQASDFEKLKKLISIYEYDIPRYMMKPQGRHGYAKLHNWIRNETINPYYLQSSIGKVFIGYVPEAEITQVYDYNHENALECRPFEGFSDIKKLHSLLKVLMADYFHRDKKFISNNQFYLDVEAIHSKTSNRVYRRVIKLDPKEHYQINKANYYELFIDSRVTRLLKVDFDNRDHSKITYCFDMNNGEIFFRQARIKEIKSSAEKISLFEENTDNRYRSKNKYHSIASLEKHEKSTSVRLNHFGKYFIKYLTNLGLNVRTKILEFEKIKAESKIKSLSVRDFSINVVDKRFWPRLSITEIIKLFANASTQKVNFVHRPPRKDDNILILMDYNRDDFETLLKDQKSKDGYEEVKKNFPQTPSQGFCINENHFKEKKDEWDENKYSHYQSIKIDKKNNEKTLKTNLLRNFQISVQQLLLKSWIVNRIDISHRLPHYDLIKDMVFVYCYTKKGNRLKTILYIEDNILNFECMLTSQNANRVLKRFSDIENFDKIISLREQKDEYAGVKKGDLYLMLSKNFIWEIKELQEKVLYPDEVISKNLQVREQRFAIDKFKLSQQAVEFFDEEKIETYNRFLDGLTESKISYEQLVGIIDRKKGTGKYRKSIYLKLGIGKEVVENGKIKGYETKLIRALNKHATLPQIKEKKQGGIFKLNEGIWYDKNTNEYFVGEKNRSYKFDQDKGFQIRKVIIHKGVFSKKQFFPLLDVEFVRYKGFTVIPYPFNLIKIYNQ